MACIQLHYQLLIGHCDVEKMIVRASDVYVGASKLVVKNKSGYLNLLTS